VVLKVVPHKDNDLCSFVMLPDAGPMSTTFPFLFVSSFVFFIRPNSLYP
jgi:hypothetical protein